MEERIDIEGRKIETKMEDGTQTDKTRNKVTVVCIIAIDWDRRHLRFFPFLLNSNEFEERENKDSEFALTGNPNWGKKVLGVDCPVGGFSHITHSLTR